MQLNDRIRFNFQADKKSFRFKENKKLQAPNVTHDRLKERLIHQELWKRIYLQLND